MAPLVRSLSIPAPRPLVAARMRDLATFVGGPLEPLAASSGHPAGFRLPMASMLVLGTACSRPLLCEEAQALQEGTTDHVVIVRLAEDPNIHSGFTADLLPRSAGGWLENYRGWQEPTGSRYWLVPSTGEGQSARLSPWGLDLVCRAPFYTLDERERGFSRFATALRRLRGSR